MFCWPATLKFASGPCLEAADGEAVMACCVLIASVVAALLWLKRLVGGDAAEAADPRAWRLVAERSDD